MWVRVNVVAIRLYDWLPLLFVPSLVLSYHDKVWAALCHMFVIVVLLVLIKER